MTDLINAVIIVTTMAGLLTAIMIYRKFRDIWPPPHRKIRWHGQTTYSMIGPVIKWQPWFAWRPVRTISGRVVWWRKIYRTLGNDYVDHDDWSWYHYGTLFDVLSQ